MAYNTRNPVGSTDPRDLFDNAGIIDQYANGRNPLYPDRFGVQRLSFSGMRYNFVQSMSGWNTAFQQFLAGSGFEAPVQYAAGVTLERATQTFARDNIQYRIKDPAELPYTLTGNSRRDIVNGDLLTAEMVQWEGRSLSGALKAMRSTDLSSNSDKAQALIDFAASLGGQRGRVEPGVYILTKQVDLPGNVDLDLTGVTLDFSAADVANFPDLICVRPAPGTLVQLPALSANPAIGQCSITFSASHNLIPGDAIILHDDKPFSYSAFRANYQQGQFAVVRSINGLTVNLTAPILASMTVGLDGNGKGLKVYKMNPVRPRIRGADILMPTSGGDDRRASWRRYS